MKEGLHWIKTGEEDSVLGKQRPVVGFMVVSAACLKQGNVL
jgi:hypothetical protein